MEIKNQITFKTKIALAATVIFWASAFVGIRAGLHQYSPEGLALLRYLIASLCMVIIYFRMPVRSSMRLLDRIGLMGVGVLGIGIYNLTLNYGELSTSSGTSSFIISQGPIITAVFAMLFLGERVTPMRLLGFGISLIGVLLITAGERNGFTWDKGIVYILVAAVAGGLFSVLQKPFLKRYHAIEATAYIIWGATLFLSMYALKLEHDLSHASISGTLTVIYLGIFPAAVAYIAWSYALAEIPAARAVSFLYFMPFVATLLGWICLGEVPVFLTMVGGLLSIIGVWVVNRSYRIGKTEAAVS